MTVGRFRNSTISLPPDTPVRVQLPDGRVVPIVETATEYVPVEGQAIDRRPVSVTLVAMTPQPLQEAECPRSN